MFAKKSLIPAVLASAMVTATPAEAGTDPYIGEVMMVAFTFCPRGTAELNGQMLPVAQHAALFSLLGTTYGGDGQTTFQLPDLRAHLPTHAGEAPGLGSFEQGNRLVPSVVPRRTDGTGDGQAAVILPVLTLRYCIAVQGVYPSRN